MKVIVDTSVWSLALRRKIKQARNEIRILESIINGQNICMLGPIRQEILSGIKDNKQFEKLRDYLSAFDDHKISIRDYERAAEFYNSCRSKGIQGSNIDFLICAVSVNNRFPIFSTDKDFEKYAKHIPIVLMREFLH